MKGLDEYVSNSMFSNPLRDGEAGEGSSGVKFKVLRW